MSGTSLKSNSAGSIIGRAAADSFACLLIGASEAFDRCEVVVLMGESRDGQKQKFLPIIRSGNGKFFGFGESDVTGMDKMEGRFAQILPPKVPGNEMRLLAQAMLKIKGVKVARTRNAPRLPRGRR